MAGWQGVQAQVPAEQISAAVEAAARELAGLPLAVLRNRRELGQRADAAVRSALRAHPGQVSPVQLQAMIAQVVARVGGLGFLDALIPPNSHAFTDVLVNADGRVWGRRKSAMRFEDLELRPSKDEVWRAVEALLAPEGRACSESTPSVDVKIPRNRELGFGGARVKALHPIIAPGDGYPTLAVRLFEPEPVEPSQIVQWGVFPAAVLAGLTEAVGSRLRAMVIGGTGTGKTTLLSALCHGIPNAARIVKIEDPEEIWVPHPNVTTLEARSAPPGSNVPSYTVADGVDDALRLAPAYVILGEVRRGDAALALFRAMMSDHAGLTTLHADGPEHAAYRIGVIMYSDAGVQSEAARGLFVEAVDLVVQIGWVDDRRAGLGIWEVAGQAGNEVKFRQLWQPGDAALTPPQRRRG
jgi:pilus assembly protein CpaF